MTTITSSSIVEMHKLHVIDCDDDNVYLIRWGGTSIALVRRRMMNAIRALRDRSLSDAQLELDYSDVSGQHADLSRVVHVLLRANLVQRVDGVRVSRREVTARTFCAFLYRYYIVPAILFVGRLLPMSCVPFFTALINYSISRHRIAHQMRLAASNLEMIFRGVDRSRLTEIWRRHYRYLTRTKLDPEHVMDRSARSVDRWMRREFACDGLDIIRTETSRSRGAVVAMLHFNRFGFAPLFLASHGFNVCVIASPPIQVKLSKRIAWFRSFASLPGYGDIQLRPNFNLDSVRDVVSLMRQGYVVLSYPDSPAQNSDERTTERMKFFGMEYSGLPAGRFNVQFRDHSLNGGVWYFWLASYLGTVVIPGVMLPKCGKSILTFSAPLRPRVGLSCKDARDDLARQFFEFWTANLEENPDQWFGWHSLKRWNPTERAATLRDCASAR